MNKLDVNVEKEKISNNLISFIEELTRKIVKSMFIINTHIEGAIVGVLTENKYSVLLINGETYELPSRAGLTLSVGNAVLVAQVNGDINKRFIDCKRPY